MAYRLLIYLFSIVFLYSTSSAQSQKNYYARADGGIFTVSDKNIQTYLNNKGLGSIGFGYQYNDILSFDINLQYREIGTRRVSFSNYTSLVNVNLIVINNDFFPIYFTGGMGVNHNDSKSNQVEYKRGSVTSTLTSKIESKNNFAWNFGVGTKLLIVNNV